ncbi:MAG: hypothetical protein A3G81_25455 [Betaproteobacteria bacterium RIFCSPLOWO2_12_FULL_65_14]|nr:MAG: hypothetical protein A3G81_25455 [Betaproteobacteria bacterium RIFCSPLOWO2_12_FULL_65_14]
MLRKMFIVSLILAPALAVAAAPGGRRVDSFKKADADGNGMLSRAEVEKSLPKLARQFDVIDANRDGNLTPEEIRAWSRARRGHRRETAGAKFQEYFKRADADGDGALSRAEAGQGMPRIARKFDAIDANRDGKVTQDEMRAWFQARRAARERRS